MKPQLVPLYERLMDAKGPDRNIDAHVQWLLDGPNALAHTTRTVAAQQLGDRSPPGFYDHRAAQIAKEYSWRIDIGSSAIVFVDNYSASVDAVMRFMTTKFPTMPTGAQMSLLEYGIYYARDIKGKNGGFSSIMEAYPIGLLLAIVQYMSF